MSNANADDGVDVIIASSKEEEEEKKATSSTVKVEATNMMELCNSDLMLRIIEYLNVIESS